MYVESTDHLDHDAKEVYELVRDELPKLLPHLPDVEELTQLEYERTSDTKVRIVNRWRARAQVPSMVAKFLPPDTFVWTDYAEWDDAEQKVDYRLEGFGYEVRGTNYFQPDGDGTLIKVTAHVTIHPEKFKVPKLLFNKVFPLIEGTVKKALQPNLTSLARGLKSYFQDRA